MQATRFKQTWTPVPPELARDPASSPALSAPTPGVCHKALLGHPEGEPQGFCWQEAHSMAGRLAGHVVLTPFPQGSLMSGKHIPPHS